MCLICLLSTNFVRNMYIMNIKKFFLSFLLALLTMPIAAQHGKVALVLGGGGAKGAAEVGVIKVLEEEGIPVDMVVGTSIGSICGALYAVGYTGEQMDSLFRCQDWGYLLSDREDPDDHSVFSFKNNVPHVFGRPLWKDKDTNKGKSKALDDMSGEGLVRGRNIITFFEQVIPNTDSLASFDSLQRPFRAVAYDLRSKQEVHIDHGSIPLAMRASMSIPLFFTPVEIEGKKLIDGGIVNNLPVDVARDMGADFVIAIDLSVEGADLNREETFWDKMRMKFGISDRPKYEQNRPNADLYLNPPLQGYNVESFSKRKIAEMIEIGEKYARKNIKQIRKFAKQVRKSNKSGLGH